MNPKEPIEQIKLGDSLVTLLGAAHVSKSSADMVQQLLNEGQYDAVAVELCPARHHAIINPDALAQMDLFKVFKQGKAAMVAANLALGAYQQRLADQFGIEAGAEQRAAIDVARERHLPVLLIDRDIGTTLRRVAHNVAWWKRIGIVGGLLGSILSKEEVSEDEIEQLKQGDMLETTFAEFAEERQDLYEPLIDERDRYMTARLLDEIRQHGHENILAVLGAGHVRGITQYLQQGIADPQETIAQLEQLPPKSSWLKYLPWLIVLLICTGFFIGFQRSPDLGWQLVWDWVVINGGLSALGALFAAGHPLTVLTAFVAAPITSLNPTIGAGMVTATAELFFRKPRVGDFSALRHDTTHWRGWWKNRVSRTLLVFLFSTIGSAAGTYIAGFRIFDKLTG
ncbi:MAG: TraB/GumN family protein [Chromatiales bacterium]|jgi:pheromone shutdown-related protein TraB